MSKRKPKAKPFIPPGVQAFFWLIAVAGLAGAAIWAWQRGHRPPPPVGLYREAGWMPPIKSDRWKCIVIHHSAGEVGAAARLDKMHREERGWDELGYHFVIGNGSESANGQVEVGPRWTEQKHGAHCKTDDHFYNEHGIGICLVGNFNNHPPSVQQMQSLVRLVQFLCVEFNIPRDKIFTHGGVTGKTECPGKDFDVEALRHAIVVMENPKSE